MRKLYIIPAAVVAAAVLVWWSLPGRDPRRAVLGDWKENRSRLCVEITPQRAEWRGYGCGRLTYEWVQAEKEPYLVRLFAYGKQVTASMRFNGDDEFDVEPDLWEHLPEGARELLREYNRSHNQPERRIRFTFRRVENHAK